MYFPYTDHYGNYRIAEEIEGYLVITHVETPLEIKLYIFTRKYITVVRTIETCSERTLV